MYNPCFPSLEICGNPERLYPMRQSVYPTESDFCPIGTACILHAKSDTVKVALDTMRRVSDGVRSVTDGVRRVPDRVRRVSDMVRRVYQPVRRSSSW